MAIDYHKMPFGFDVSRESLEECLNVIVDCWTWSAADVHVNKANIRIKCVDDLLETFHTSLDVFVVVFKA